MDDEYFVTRPSSGASAEEAEALRLAALLRRDAEQARLQRRVRGVLQVSGAVAALLTVVLVVVALLGVLHFFQSLPF